MANKKPLVTKDGITQELPASDKIATSDIAGIDPTTAQEATQTTINTNLFQYANDGKTAIATAITAKGVSSSPSDTFATLATNIGNIPSGATINGAVDATAKASGTITSGDILEGTYLPSYTAPDVIPASSPYAGDIIYFNSEYYMAVGIGSTPYLYIYKMATGVWTRMTNPVTLPTGWAGHCKFCEFGGILYLAVGHGGSTPFISTYYLSGSTWIKIANPSDLPGSSSYGIDIIIYNTEMYLMTVWQATGYMIIWKWNGSAWIKETAPATLPTGNCNACSFYIFNSTLYCVIAHATSPYITIYYLTGGVWTKIANPASLPTTTCSGSDFFEVGGSLHIALGSNNSFATGSFYLYKLVDTTWVKQTVPILTRGTVYRISCKPFNSKIIIMFSVSSDKYTLFEYDGTTFKPIGSPEIISSVGTQSVTSRLCIANSELWAVLSNSYAPYLTTSKFGLKVRTKNFANFDYITTSILTGIASESKTDGQSINIKLLKGEL